jgi:hypothetical protein
MQGIKIARIYRWTRQTKQPEKLPIDHGDIFPALVNTVPLILLAQLSPPALLLPYSLFGKQTYKHDGSVLLPLLYHTKTHSEDNIQNQEETGQNFTR